MAEEDPGCPICSDITQGAFVDTLVSNHHGRTHKMASAHRCIVSFVDALRFLTKTFHGMMKETVMLLI